MGYKISDLFVNIDANTKDAESGLKRVDAKTKTTGKAFGTLGKAVAVGFAVAAVAGITKVSKAVILAASDAEETRNKFNVVFSDISEDAQDAATNLSDNFGLSTVAAEDLLSATGDLLTGFGFTQDSALDLSDKVNQLAVDLASFTNFSGGAKGASEALTKALLGERESVKALGISILEEDVKAQVLLNTKNGLTFATERQAKAQATLDIAISQSKNAQGDYNRSQDAFANKSREATAAVDDLKAALGKGLLPTATSGITVFEDVTSALAGYVEQINLAKGFSADLKDGTIDETRSLEDLNSILEKLQKNRAGAGGRGASIDREITAVKALIDAYGIQDTFLTRRAGLAVSEAAAEQARVDKELENAQLLIDQAEERLEREAELKEIAAEAELERLEELEEEKARILETGIEYADTLRSEEFARQQSAADNDVRLAMEANAKILADKQALADAEKLLNENRLAASTSFFGGMSALFGVAGAESRGLLIAQKAFSAVQAGINTGVAFTKTLADGGPFPLNAINAAGIAASGIAQQIQILSTPIPSFATGGIVPGAPSVNDNVLTNLASGEEVISENDSRHSFSGGGNKAEFVINIDGKVLAKTVINDYVNTGQYLVNLKRGSR